VADAANDLAVIQVQGDSFPAAEIGKADDLRQGQDIGVFGYPLEGYLPASGNFTVGIVSALAGPSNNSSLIQITAPVQPGNSGGPVLNKKGQVVGVVVGKADVIKLAQITNDIAQNINFAISVGTVVAFLDGNHVQYSKPGFSILNFDKDSAGMAESARRISVKVECWN
jgi:S1-C subfamily serine protease